MTYHLVYQNQKTSPSGFTLNRRGRLWLEELDNPYAQTARQECGEGV